MRYRSIDFMRSYAIVVMVIVHFLENLSGTREWSPDGFGAPIFTFLAGVSYRLWLFSRESRGVTQNQISRETIRRGLFLIGLGFLFNGLIWLPEDLFTWDVLTFLGVTMCVLNVARSMPARAILLAIGLSVCLSPVLQRVVDYPAYWSNGYFETEWTLSELLTGLLVTGYFPVFPWIAIPLSGFIAAPALLGMSGTSDRERKLWIITGMSLVTLALLLLVFRWTLAWGVLWIPAWTMYPASLLYMTGVLGMVILLQSGLHRWIDERGAAWIPEGVYRRARRFSQYSLSIYLLHHIVHLWPLWMYGYYTAGDPTLYWGTVLSWWPSFFLAIAFLVCCDWLLGLVERHRIVTVESLMRWLCE